MNPTGLPYEVTLVVEAADDTPETRTVIAAFADAETADWFTDQLVVKPGTHFETPGLTPAFLQGADLASDDVVPLSRQPSYIRWYPCCGWQSCCRCSSPSEGAVSER